MRIDLSGKNVLVTGGTRGIGSAISLALAEAGAHVAVHGNRSMEEAAALQKRYPNVSLFKADLNQPLEVEDLFNKVTADLGSLDVLINNAGIAIDSNWEKDLGEWTSEWDITMSVNLRSTAILCKLAMEHFKTRGGGIIINIASRAAFRGDTMSYLAYAASKGGMVALTRSIARGMGKQGITAFTVAPGFTRTAMAEQFIEQYGESYAASDIALKEMTRPEDIAPFIVFLSSGNAAHATGGTFDFNAGSYVH